MSETINSFTFTSIVYASSRSSLRSRSILTRILSAIIDPLILILLGLILIVLTFLLYPGHYNSIIPGIFIGMGVSILLWVAYKVIVIKV